MKYIPAWMPYATFQREAAASRTHLAELHALLERPALAGIPLLVLATKNDLPGAATVEEVIGVMYVRCNSSLGEPSNPQPLTALHG